MIAETPKLLPENLSMPCYACETHPASHLCRYIIDELTIQVCLCADCMKMDTERLLKNTLGIQEVSRSSASSYLAAKGHNAIRKSL